MPDLDTIREGWDAAAREDAMFNIVTLPQYADGSWPEDEFFAHGQVEIDQMMRHVEALDVGFGHNKALDFGCGVGRLTRALSTYFTQVDGVDVSAEMLKLARRYNLDPKNVEFHQNSERLPFREGTFDLIYSRITLQHMPPDLQRGYLAEFLRVLKKDGVAVFQIPDGPEYHHPNEWLSMYGVPRGLVQQWVRELGGRLLDVELLDDASPTWLAYRYTVAP